MSDNYPHGLFTWVDLATPDPQAAKSFYSSVFEWTGEDQVDENGDYIYTLLYRDGLNVAGLGGLQAEGMPSAWSSYVGVDDVDAVVGLVAPAGGQVIMPPMDVMDTGRMAIVVDPTGAVLGLWQPGTHKGAELFGAHGAFSWNELATRDVEAAMAFYGAILPWRFEQQGDSDYWLIAMDTKVTGQGLADDQFNGGIMPIAADAAQQVPAHWAVYFTVDSADEAVAAAQAAGGTILRDPFATEFGKIAAVSDPFGASFMVIDPSQAAAG